MNKYIKSTNRPNSGGNQRTGPTTHCINDNTDTGVSFLTVCSCGAIYNFSYFNTNYKSEFD